MKKLFISVPMYGRTDEAIQHSIEEMHKIAESVFGEKLEVIQSHQPIPEGLDVKDVRLWCLGRSLQLMADADCFIGIHDDSRFPGCHLEYRAAIKYNIEDIFCVSMQECKFFDDIKRQYVGYRIKNLVGEPFKED